MMTFHNLNHLILWSCKWININEKECSGFIQTLQSNSWKSANHWKAGSNMDKTAPTSSIHCDLIAVEGIKE